MNKQENSFFAFDNKLNVYDLIERLGEEGAYEFLDSLSESDAKLLYDDPYFTLRPKQIIHNDGRRGTLALTGRGFGKNHMGSCWINQRAYENKGPILLVGQHAADVNTAMIDHGASSIIALAPEWFKPVYKKQDRVLIWPNGCIAFARSGDAPEQLRGATVQTVWCDELAKYDYLDEAWSNIMFCLREGDDPQYLITTTPRSKPLIKKMYKDPGIVKVSGAITENASLNKDQLKEMYRQYKGTKKETQELEGKIIWEEDNSLWSMEQIEMFRDKLPENILSWRIGLDPSVGSGKSRNDEAGIVVACSALVNGEKHAYIVSDRSIKGSTATWAGAVKRALDDFPRATIIAESNQGGEMILHTLENAGVPSSKVELRHHMRSKYERAQPVALKAEQGLVHHTGIFDVLEEEMTTFIGESGQKSPNRLDAAVMAVHDLIIDNKATLVVSRMGI